ncbi:Proline/betaine transporter [compost metagenome]
MLVMASVLFLLMTFPLFGMLDHQPLVVILMIQIVFGAMLAMNDGTLPSFLAEIFPTRVRFSGFAFSFNIANALFGGTAPFIATWLIQMTGNKMAPAWYLLAAALVALLAMLAARETAHNALKD